MDEYNPMKSLQLVCCVNKSWYHKECLKEMAFSMNDDFVCPNCNDKDEFQHNMLANGIYIPDKNYLPKPSKEIEPNAKKRRVHKDWIFDKTFESKQEAVVAIKAERYWSYHYRNKSDDGIRINYRCNLMKSGPASTQCASGIFLLFDSTCQSVHLYRADTIHTHGDENNNENAVKKICGDIETEIRSSFESNMKPKAILYNLVRKGFTPPTKATLNNFLAKLRKEKFGCERLNYGTLELWLSESSNVPSNEDEPFIVSYDMHIDDENNEKSTFRFLVSTKLLLKSAVSVEKVHTDATYKIVWQGFPILLIGTTDSNRKFHPFGVCVSTNERSEDFEFVFQSMKVKVKELFQADIDPDVLICDAADSIHNGWERVFPSHSNNIVMCWAHVRRAVSKNLSKYLKEQKRRNEFLFDLDKLQLARNETFFDVASKLFVKKWVKVSKELVTYFENEWLIQHRNWYEGFRPKTPSSNNALESKNKGIKDEFTLRERLDLSQFRVVLFAMIQQWSIEYSSGLNVINFAAPNIELEQWTDGYNFAKSNVKITSKRSGNYVTYTIPHGSSTTDNDIKYCNMENFQRLS
ncbi:uncharacterized protein LOC129571604 [Sitodiplosis mosellana]|uniref:uncharacterized protein LOC129571604 n=1 Tax=Sitodiplosis mosellana TaxID=263140 RepID=UPI002444522D|nr:uncharacterized protein LOC129571604 [Sitodiplosis mosellana]XP_055307395.1 uncharacterized protein LOC129571604 [Sitodiplosis mosellana]